MPVNSSLNLSLLRLTTVTFQKYFWMTSGALHVSLELRLKEIFRETLYWKSGGLQTFKSKPLLVSSVLILDFRPKVYLIIPEVSITVVYVFAGLYVFDGQEHFWFLVRWGVPLILIPFLSSWLSRNLMPHSFHPDVHTWKVTTTLLKHQRVTFPVLILIPDSFQGQASPLSSIPVIWQSVWSSCCVSWH